MKISSRTFLSVLFAIFAVTAIASLASAAPLSQDNNPVVIINKPPSNSAYAPGDIITVESVSASPVGIVQVDLLVDGQVVSTEQTPGELPQVQFTLIQRWLANLPGAHVITVRATDSENRTGQASINVTVLANTPTPVPTNAPPAPTNVPPPTATPFTCVLDSTFVSDVTIPDNTQIAPGATFVKTWTLQNNGTCAWDPATVAVFVSGSRMAGASPSPVGAVQPGQNFNLSINFVAPGTPGTYRSSWKIQAGNGTQFGETFYVKIVVPGAPTPVPPPPPPPSGCNGTPQISSFTVDNSTIKKGQSTTLRWGLVGNADSVYLETPDGSGGVPTPGQSGIQPNQTSSYTLAAYCKGVRAQAQVTVNVQGGGGGGTGAQGSINGVEVGNKGNRWEVRVFYSWNGAGGPAQVCASAQGSGSNPCTNARADAPYAVLNLQGKKIGQVTACLYDRSGAEVACGSN